MKISLILPVYNEQDILDEVLAKYKRDLDQIMQTYGGSWEIIAINDGSTDTTLDRLMANARQSRNFRVVNFTERFGKQAAITAGMDAATGTIAITADIDLLNPIGLLKRMVDEHLTQNQQIVYAYREKIGREKSKQRRSKLWVDIGTIAFGVEGTYTGKANVALYSRAVVDVLVALPNKNKFLRTMDNWVGWSVHKIEFKSEYTREQIAAKVRAAAIARRAEGIPDVHRDAAREHTASRIYAFCALIMATIFLAMWIALSITTEVDAILHIVAILAFVVMLAVGLMFMARSVLVKRIGIIYRPEESIYAVESVIN